MLRASDVPRLLVYTADAKLHIYRLHLQARSGGPGRPSVAGHFEVLFTTSLAGLQPRLRQTQAILLAPPQIVGTC